MFGCAARVGLLSVGLPGREVVNLRDESDIEEILESKNEHEDAASSSIDSPDDGKHLSTSYSSSPLI